MNALCFGIDLLASVIVSVVIGKFYMSMITVPWCRTMYINTIEETIKKKIDDIESKVFKNLLICGAILGIVITILLFKFGIYHLGWLGLKWILVWLLLLVIKVFAPVLVCTVPLFIWGLKWLESYFIKYFGKTLAFVGMINDAKKIKQNFPAAENFAFSFAGDDYGTKYLAILGNGLDSAIKRTVWTFRLSGGIIGCAAAYLLAYFIFGSIWLQVFLGLGAGLAGLFAFNYFSKNYCIAHYGYLSTNYQLHVDIASIKSVLYPQENSEVRSETTAELNTESANEENTVTHN